LLHTPFENYKKVIHIIMTVFSSKPQTITMKTQTRITFALQDNDDQDKEGFSQSYLETINYHRFVSWEEDDTLVGLRFAPSLDWEDDLSSDDGDEDDEEEEDDDNDNADNLENSHHVRENHNENNISQLETQSMNKISMTSTAKTVPMTNVSTLKCSSNTNRAKTKNVQLLRSFEEKIPRARDMSRDDSLASTLNNRQVTNNTLYARHLFVPRSSRSIVGNKEGKMMKSSSYTKCLSRDAIPSIRHQQNEHKKTISSTNLSDQENYEGPIWNRCFA
jgi:hypothetical protein